MPFSGVQESFYLQLGCFSWWKTIEVCYSNCLQMNQLVMHYFNTSHGHFSLLGSLSSLLVSVAVAERSETADGCSLWSVKKKSHVFFTVLIEYLVFHISTLDLYGGANSWNLGSRIPRKSRR